MATYNRRVLTADTRGQLSSPAQQPAGNPMARDYSNAYNTATATARPTAAPIAAAPDSPAIAAQATKAATARPPSSLTTAFVPGQAEGAFTPDVSREYSRRAGTADNATTADGAPVLRNLAAYQSQAAAKVNPQFDQLRDRADAQASANREQLPQVMAARYGGIMGTRGGRMGSAMTRATQAEGQAINEIEGQRQQATIAMQEALQKQDFDRALQLYQVTKSLEMQQAQLDLQQSQSDWEQEKWQQQFDYNKTNDLRDYNYQIGRDEVGDTRWQTEFDYNKGRDSVKDNQWGQQWDWETNPDNWKNQMTITAQDLDNAYKKAQISKMYSSGSGGGGSSSGGSGGSGNSGVDYNTALIRATALANADPRLESGEYSLPQLIDAWMTQIAYESSR